VFRYSRYRASYISVVLSTVLLTLARACINLIISYKFLLETAHGFQYGVLIAVQIIASSFFAPKLVHLLDRLERPSTPLLLFYFLSAVLYGLMAQYSSFNSFVCFTFASTLLIALESAILYKLVPMVFREKKLRVSMSGLNRPRHCHFFCQLCWFHLRFTLLNHMSIFYSGWYSPNNHRLYRVSNLLSY